MLLLHTQNPCLIRQNDNTFLGGGWLEGWGIHLVFLSIIRKMYTEILIVQNKTFSLKDFRVLLNTYFAARLLTAVLSTPPEGRSLH